ncbi:MAG: hypothetical protein ACFFBD_21615, partial [Candidatus Hodarchaeota archaeon]
MQTRRFDCYDVEATAEMALSQLLIGRLKYLDRLLKHLKTDKPEQFGTVISDLQARLEKIITEEKCVISLPQIVLDLEVLNHYPHLLKASMAALLIFLNFSKYKNHDIESKIAIRRADIIRSWFLPYYMAVSLTSIMSKPEAVQYYQGIVDSIVETSQNPDEYIESLDELRQTNTEYLKNI